MPSRGAQTGEGPLSTGLFVHPAVWVQIRRGAVAGLQPFQSQGAGLSGGLEDCRSDEWG